MIVLEHEAKALLKAAGLPIPDGEIATTSAEAQQIADRLGGPAIVKSQIPIGGRMKAGGILFADAPADAERAADRLLGQSIKGHAVDHVLVERRVPIVNEVFIAVTYDNRHKTPVLIVTREGGIDVEEAQATVRHTLSLSNGFSGYEGRLIAAQIALSGRHLVQFGAIVHQLVERFIEWDALLLECNPVILDAEGRWWIADVHLELDDDAHYRQDGLQAALPRSRALAERRSDFEQKALEIDHADHRGVAGRLIPFDGNIGLLIGGGGASLTTMDAVLDAGLKPANYCEIGGNPSVWKIKELTRLILFQDRVDRLVVIMNVVSNTRVDLVARGVIKGILETGHDPAEVIAAFRIPGSWEEEGRAILEHYNVRYFGRETSIDQVVAAIS